MRAASLTTPSVAKTTGTFRARIVLITACCRRSERSDSLGGRLRVVRAFSVLRRMRTHSAEPNELRPLAASSTAPPSGGRRLFEPDKPHELSGCEDAADEIVKQLSEEALGRPVSWFIRWTPPLGTATGARRRSRRSIGTITWVRTTGDTSGAGRRVGQPAAATSATGEKKRKTRIIRP